MSSTLCRNWSQNGSCRYGKRCHFAHSKSKKGRGKQHQQQQRGGGRGNQRSGRGGDRHDQYQRDRFESNASSHGFGTDFAAHDSGFGMAEPRPSGGGFHHGFGGDSTGFDRNSGFGGGRDFGGSSHGFGVESGGFGSSQQPSFDSGMRPLPWAPTAPSYTAAVPIDSIEMTPVMSAARSSGSFGAFQHTPPRSGFGMPAERGMGFGFGVPSPKAMGASSFGRNSPTISAFSASTGAPKSAFGLDTAQSLPTFGRRVSSVSQTQTTKELSAIFAASKQSVSHSAFSSRMDAMSVRRPQSDRSTGAGAKGGVDLAALNASSKWQYTAEDIAAFQQPAFAQLGIPIKPPPAILA